jgi:ABC-type iron transport system FetAB permease component
LSTGLKEIISALLNARKIFARVRNYCIYRIASTIQLAFFFFIAGAFFKLSSIILTLATVLCFGMGKYYPASQREVGSVRSVHLMESHAYINIVQENTIFGVGVGKEEETVFTLPVIALVLITILNDGTIITICRLLRPEIC